MIFCQLKEIFEWKCLSPSRNNGNRQLKNIRNNEDERSKAASYRRCLYDFSSKKAKIFSDIVFLSTNASSL